MTIYRFTVSLDDGRFSEFITSDFEAMLSFIDEVKQNRASCSRK